ncbi:MAG: hypothetical protein D3920_09745 [Candidatus Electrothrix sp. AW2]|nr:hypothetical protein [Candidatus Electrothrix gigas]
MHSFPAVLIGIFFGCFDQVNRRFRRIVLLFFFVIIIILITLNIGGVGITYLFGVIPCLLLLNRDDLITQNKIIILLSRATFGVYLMHGAALSFCHLIGVNGFLLPIIAYTISLFTVISIQQQLPENIKRYIV